MTLSDSLASENSEKPSSEHVPNVSVVHEDDTKELDLTTEWPASSGGDRFRNNVRKFMHTMNPSHPRTPKEKFKHCVRRVIQANLGPAPEAGVNPNAEGANAMYGHIRAECVISVTDYSVLRDQVQNFGNAELVDFLKEENKCKMEPWTKVRWINVGGISWDVLSALSMRYDLHPMALSDIVNPRGQTRSKADSYPKHLFIRILCHAISGTPTVTPIPSSTLDLDDDLGLSIYEDHPLYNSAGSSTLRRKLRRRQQYAHTYAQPDLEKGKSNWNPFGGLTDIARQHQEHAKHEIMNESTDGGTAVNVTVLPCFMFYLPKENTVISVHPNSDLSLTAPITRRLRHRKAGLRRSASATLLVHSLIDLVLDRALEVIDEYHGKILKLEHDILFNPQVKSVRSLHILAGDLALHKRTFEPIKAVSHGLRSSSAFFSSSTSHLSSKFKIESESSPTNSTSTSTPPESNLERAALLLDDHMDYILTSLDTFAGITQNLIDYTFNMASYETNEVMRRLTLATIIFLPPTFLTGYFGMNFTHMWSVRNHSDVVFWIIALPLMTILLPVFIYPDLIKMYDQFQRLRSERAANRAVKRA